MTPTEILSIVQPQSGRPVSICFKTEGKPAAAFKAHKLEKITKGAFRVGISFENLKGVREGIESGERGIPEAPKGKKWILYPFHLQKLDGSIDYLRLYYPTGGFIQIPKVSYKVDGIEVTKEQYNSYLTPSDAAPKKRDPNLDLFDVKMENILSIGKE